MLDMDQTSYLIVNVINRQNPSVLERTTEPITVKHSGLRIYRVFKKKNDYIMIITNLIVLVQSSSMCIVYAVNGNSQCEGFLAITLCESA